MENHFRQNTYPSVTYAEISLFLSIKDWVVRIASINITPLDTNFALISQSHLPRGEKKWKKALKVTGHFLACLLLSHRMITITPGNPGDDSGRAENFITCRENRPISAAVWLPALHAGLTSTSARTHARTRARAHTHTHSVYICLCHQTVSSKMLPPAPPQDPQPSAEQKPSVPVLSKIRLK